MSKQKAIGQAMMQVHQIMKPLQMYGQEAYCDVAEGMLKDLLSQVYDRGNGKDTPIQIDKRRIKY